MTAMYPVETSLGEVRVIDEGSGDVGVICLHGAAARAERWRRNLPAFAAENLRAIAYDLPGHGFSQAPGGTVPSVSQMAQQVAEVARSVGLIRHVVLGTSLGGLIALRHALDSNEGVQGVVAVGTLGLIPYGAGNSSSGIRRRSYADTEQKLIRLLGENPVNENLLREEHGYISCGTRQGFLDNLASFMETEVDQSLLVDDLMNPARNFPILFVWGSLDPVISVDDAAEIISGIKDSSLVRLTRSAHAPYLTEPEGFNQAVITFLASTLDVATSLTEVVAAK
jgi:pimeloyl-ACP methyl ester carboxylesterase